MVTSPVDPAVQDHRPHDEAVPGAKASTAWLAAYAVTDAGAERDRGRPYLLDVRGGRHVDADHRPMRPRRPSVAALYWTT
jgi:hypothetical protein